MTERTAVHLVGSVPLPTVDAVFRAVCGGLGDRLPRVPDGETGSRGDFIGWQADLLLGHPQFEPTGEIGHYNPKPLSRLRPGVDPAEIRFTDLGYASAALDSYRTFERLAEHGVIPATARFQVCLPTPTAPVGAWVVPDDRAAVLPAYTARMRQEVAEIAAVVPPERLAVQWDVAAEIVQLDARFAERGPVRDAKLDEFVEVIAAMIDAVPAGVEAGVHLCYGDFDHKHGIEPVDMGTLVDVSNAIAARVDHELAWMHLPVPRDRSDAAYFAPLRDLRLAPATELYLGLVHLTDGLDGARARIETARRVVDAFGISTECGWGRRDPASIPALIDLHEQVAALMDLW